MVEDHGSQHQDLLHGIGWLLEGMRRRHLFRSKPWNNYPLHSIPLSHPPTRLAVHARSFDLILNTIPSDHDERISDASQIQDLNVEVCHVYKNSFEKSLPSQCRYTKLQAFSRAWYLMSHSYDILPYKGPSSLTFPESGSSMHQLQLSISSPQKLPVFFTHHLPI